ncbi:MAG TPA: TRAP transporter TatT component family protein, partial [Thermoanaerobaculia bacterium]|nr:TRAP transporter TatT component family protein [Thermoanaerobaculia bacterium]
DYGLRALDARHAGLSVALANDATGALGAANRDDVPALYWTAASWGAAIALSKDDPAMVADLPLVEALIDRALALDESWNHGSLHSFLISYEPARPGAGPAGYDRATKRFERAVALSEGKLASPYVAWAESVAVAKQDAEGFGKALESALAIDPAARPEWRLENLIAQERARRLLARTDELFLVDEEDDAEEEGAEEPPPPPTISLNLIPRAGAVARAAR